MAISKIFLYHKFLPPLTLFLTTAAPLAAENPTKLNESETFFTFLLSFYDLTAFCV